MHVIISNRGVNTIFSITKGVFFFLRIPSLPAAFIEIYEIVVGVIYRLNELNLHRLHLFALCFVYGDLYIGKQECFPL